jgi:hypothetical protein
LYRAVDSTSTTVADNALCWVRVVGQITQARVSDVAVLTGDKLATDATGTWDETAETDEDTILALALEPCTSWGQRVWIYMRQ